MLHLRSTHTRRSAAYVRFQRDLHALLHELGVTRRGWSPYRIRAAAAGVGDTPEAEPGRLVVGAVKTFVETHVDEPLDLERLAQRVHLSKYHFARTFRETEGETPWTYVQRARVRRAKDLLDEGVPLSEVALRAGFYDQSHLTRTFKRFEGMTPGQYRKERKNMQD